MALLGITLMKLLHDAGLITNTTSRVIIDAQLNGAVHIYIDTYPEFGPGVLNAMVEQLNGAEVIQQEQDDTASEADSQ